MDVVNHMEISVLILFTLFCGFNCNVLSSPAGFGLTPLKRIGCNHNVSDPHACYEARASIVPCLNVEVRFDKCKQQTQSILANSTGNAERNGNSTVLHAYYHNSFRRHHELFDGSCVELIRSNCTQYRCTKRCCNGWGADSTGQCTKLRSLRECSNGGVYHGSTQECVCRQGYSGSACEIAVCQPGCLHGGQCVPTGTGDNICICPPHSTGTYCQNLRCPEPCQNGGECITDGPIPTCVCPSGFYGKTCAHAVADNSTCPPPISTVCIDLTCNEGCATDTHCPSGQVCCTNGCCMKCVKPRSPGCLHNGVLHKPRALFRMECMKCLCRIDGSTACMEDLCPCGKAEYTADNCCRDCHGQGSSLNCSSGIKKLYVDSHHDYLAVKNLNIKASDVFSTVHYSPSYLVIRRYPVSVRDIAIVKVTATHGGVQTAKCDQRVLVVDRILPYFFTCPSDIYGTEGDTVSWTEPRASDNVGVMSLVSNLKNKQVFPVGLTMIAYTAQDYDDNKAFCEFNVHVSTREYPEYTQQSTVSSTSLSIILGSVTSLVVLLIIILLTVFICMRFRSTPATRTNARYRGNRRDQVSIHTVSNGTYNGMDGPFIGQSGATLKPPPYSPEANPPTYDEVVSYAHNSVYLTPTSIPPDQPPVYDA